MRSELVQIERPSPTFFVLIMVTLTRTIYPSDYSLKPTNFKRAYFCASKMKNQEVRQYVTSAALISYEP